jgi:hypothetical protein
MAAGLILTFGSLLVWSEVNRSQIDSDPPLIAEVVVPQPLNEWLQSDEGLTLHELVEALEGGGG